MGASDQIEVILPEKCTAAEAAKLIDECSAELRKAAAAITAPIGTALFDRLHERDVALDEYISPSEWWQRPLMHAALKCGCRWECDGFPYGRAKNPRWVKTCEEHGGPVAEDAYAERGRK